MGAGPLRFRDITEEELDLFLAEQELKILLDAGIEQEPWFPAGLGAQETCDAVAHHISDWNYPLNEMRRFDWYADSCWGDLADHPDKFVLKLNGELHD